VRTGAGSVNPVVRETSGKTNRCRVDRIDAGGKGINVAKALQRDVLRAQPQVVALQAQELLDLVRRLCWYWEGAAEPVEAVEEFVRTGQARPWQRELVVAVLARAVQLPAD